MKIKKIIQSRFLRVFVGLFVVVAVSLTLSCSETLSTPANNTITEAHWNENSKTLHIKGTSKNKTSSKIKIQAADVNAIVAEAKVRSNQSWEVTLAKPPLVPCSINLDSTPNKAFVVNNAPLNCDQINQSTITVSLDGDSSVLQFEPDGTIMQPAGDMQIQSGEKVPFAALSSMSNSKFVWDFDGAVENYNIQNPGEVEFVKAGIYRVKLNVTNALGISDSQPAERIITVIPNSSAARVLNTPPPADIFSPGISSVINVGDSLFFSSNPNSANTPLTYQWDLDGAAKNSNVRVPGAITFLKAGSYNISLTTFDLMGTRSQTNNTIVVTVLENNINQAPTGIIQSPANNLSISAGESVEFLGAATDPENNMPFTYSWNFDGASGNSTEINPGLRAFNSPGVFKISLEVTDALGQIDTNPPERFITVTELAINNADLPESTIVAPAMDMTIVTGDIVTFEGSGLSPTPNDPLTFLWTFGGAAADSTMDIPGDIVFDMAGVYTVMFTVTDSLGQADPTPAQVIITVEDPVPADPPPADPPPADPPPVDPVPADPPIGEITAPTTDTTIAVGDSIDFAGMGTSPIAADPVTYLWDFDGGAPEFLDQNPGLVTFNMAGIFEVTLEVTDANGVTDPMPPTIIVTVEDPAAPPADPAAPPADTDPAADPDAPMGEIVSPDAAMTITVGETIEFIGEGESPTDLPLTYLWDFGGAAPEATVPEPGEVIFDAEGTFVVTFTVTDEAGVVDPMPPTVEIIVEPDAAAAPPPDAAPAPAAP